MNPLSSGFEIDDESRIQLATTLDLLSLLWASELTHERLNELSNSEMATPWCQLGGWLPAPVDDVTEELLEELAVDYCRLFVGPRDHLPPVQSVWESDRFGSDATQSMQQFIGAIEEFAPCVSIVDHLAVQLQFAAQLFALPLASLEDHDRSQICSAANLFFQRHLAWPKEMLQKAEDKSLTPFYRGLTIVTRQLLFAEEPVAK